MKETPCARLSLRLPAVFKSHIAIFRQQDASNTQDPKPHYGVDYAAPVGTPVLAIGDGRVTQTSLRTDQEEWSGLYTTAFTPRLTCI